MTFFLLIHVSLLQDLADDLSSELSGNFRSVVLGLLMLPTVYDAFELKNAMKVRVHDSAALSLQDMLADQVPFSDTRITKPTMNK